MQSEKCSEALRTDLVLFFSQHIRCLKTYNLCTFFADLWAVDVFQQEINPGAKLTLLFCKLNDAMYEKERKIFQRNQQYERVFTSYQYHSLNFFCSTKLASKASVDPAHIA